LIAQVRFQTGSGARVRQFLTTDGENVLLEVVGLNLRHAQLSVAGRDIPNSPQVRNSPVVTLRVQVSETDWNDWIRLGWAAVILDNV